MKWRLKLDPLAPGDEGEDSSYGIYLGQLHFSAIKNLGVGEHHTQGLRGGEGRFKVIY